MDDASCLSAPFEAWEVAGFRLKVAMSKFNPADPRADHRDGLTAAVKTVDTAWKTYVDAVREWTAGN